MEEYSSKYFIKAVDRVLGHMASMSCRVTDSYEMPKMHNEALNVSINYRGDHSGELGLIMERPLAARITCRTLGLENDFDVLDEMIEDVMRELINVTCGQFVTLMYGNRIAFKVSVPRVFRIGSKVCNMLFSNPDAYTFIIDEEPVLATVKLT
jgi:CheY-specific phosphatase CheX